MSSSGADEKDSKSSLDAWYKVPAEHSVDGKEFWGGWASFKDGNFSSALYIFDTKTNQYLTKPQTPTGREIFGILYNEIVGAGGKIEAIIGNWNQGTNLERLNKLLRDKVPFDEAALQTFTGGQAQQRGFTKVKRIGGTLNPDGVTWQSVNIEFTRPSGN
ncbi:hypothetical protein SAMN05216311_10556 [Chitinophaga sp. CF418]|nr:hypothetical protein SAMN05216311_10556 [Chitinophaga sp. CF418]